MVCSAFDEIAADSEVQYFGYDRTDLLRDDLVLLLALELTSMDPYNDVSPY
jgi:hypothetical protein